MDYDPHMEARLKAVEMSTLRLDAVLPHLATKTDLAELRTELGTELGRFRTELGGLRTELGGLRTDLHKALNEQTWKFVGCVGAIGGLLLAGVKLLH